MAWDHLSITKPHLVYIILGGFTSLFMLCSTIIKERMYIGEATVATLCGVIFGPHAANLINPIEWGSVDIVTLEFSRIVLVVQCFAVGVELPKFYMERHWKSVVFLLVPVMTYGWLITSLFIWWMVPRLNWLESLVVAACVTATDPVLASSVVGKGKFAKRVPKHLRDLLSAESGCNDGMAFPFIYLSLYLIHDHLKADKVTFHWMVYTVLYECIFGAVYGFIIGYIGRHGIRYAEEHELVDRESFLVFYFVLALFCAGSGSILGLDDLLVGFAAGVGFSNDGWFSQKTEESHVSNVIDLLLNLTYFVFLGTIIPWEMYNNAALGLTAWRLTVLAIFVILFRRLPIMLVLKPFIPDVKNWREAFFAGHFGPIGVGAIFVAILARAELETGTTTPLSELPGEDAEHYGLILLVWPIVTFLVIASIVIHGSSIAVFTLGKHINTLTLTMSYTAAPEDGPSWMNRLPRISSQSRSQARTMSDTEGEELKYPDLPPGTLPPVGIPGHWLRRQKEEESSSRNGSRTSSLVARRRKKKWDDGIGPGGPVSQSAIFPQRPSDQRLTSEKSRPPTDMPTADVRKDGDPEKEAFDVATQERRSQSETPPKVEVFEEGSDIIIENREGDILAVDKTPSPSRSRGQSPAAHPSPGEPEPAGAIRPGMPRRKSVFGSAANFDWRLDALKKRMEDAYRHEIEKRKEKVKDERKHEPARAYQFGNAVIVEDEDGEVVKTYQLPVEKSDAHAHDIWGQSLKYVGLGGLTKVGEQAPEGAASEPQAGSGVKWNWPGLNTARGSTEPSEKARKRSAAQESQAEDDKNIRFTIGGVGRRMTKDDFIREVQKLDPRTRHEVVDQSSASHVTKTIAKQDLTSEPPAAPQASVPQPAPPPGHAADTDSSNTQASSVSSGKSPASYSPPRPPVQPSSSSRSETEGETAAERRRRLAALSTIGDTETGETPAERRRREAALGMTSPAMAEDSDDEGTERVPPTRRGIRFVDVPERGRR